MAYLRVLRTDLLFQDCQLPVLGKGLVLVLFLECVFVCLSVVTEPLGRELVIFRPGASICFLEKLAQDLVADILRIQDALKCALFRGLATKVPALLDGLVVVVFEGLQHEFEQVDHARLVSDEDLDLTTDFLLDFSKVLVDEVDNTSWSHLNFQLLLLFQELLNKLRLGLNVSQHRVSLFNFPKTTTMDD